MKELIHHLAVVGMFMGCGLILLALAGRGPNPGRLLLGSAVVGASWWAYVVTA